MTSNFKQLLMNFKKHITKFKKKSKGDVKQGLELAEQVIKDIALIEKHPEYKTQKESFGKKLNQSKEGMEMYIETQTKVIEFKEKYK